MACAIEDVQVLANAGQIGCDSVANRRQLTQRRRGGASGRSHGRNGTHVLVNCQSCMQNFGDPVVPIDGSDAGDRLSQERRGLRLQRRRGPINCGNVTRLLRGQTQADLHHVDHVRFAVGAVHEFPRERNQRWLQIWVGVFSEYPDAVFELVHHQIDVFLDRGNEGNIRLSGRNLEEDRSLVDLLSHEREARVPQQVVGCDSFAAVGDQAIEHVVLARHRRRHQFPIGHGNDLLPASFGLASDFGKGESPSFDLCGALHKLIGQLAHRRRCLRMP